MSATKLLLSLMVLAGAAYAQDCTLCHEVKLVSTGGIDDDLGRYTGTWVKQGLWEGRPFYICNEECQGLRDNLIYYDGEWRVVDCKPDAPGACSGTHTMIVSTNSAAYPDSCPYDDIGPYNYCSGDIQIGDICTEYTEDATAYFECTSVNPGSESSVLED